MSAPINIEVIPVGPFEVNCILLWRTADKAVVIDAGYDIRAIKQELEKRSLSLEAQLLTHGHMDHISAAAELQRDCPAPVYLHSKDAEWAFSEVNAMPPFYPQPERPAELISLTESNTELELGIGSIEILYTPGHSPGSVCFLLKSDNLLIAGDTIFAGSVGRTDLPGGSAAVQRETLKALCTLKPELRIICGHGPETTIERELRSNPYMQIARENLK